MRKATITITAALAASFLFSGCYFLRTLHFSKSKTTVGKAVTAKMGVQPIPIVDEDPAYVLVVLIQPGDDTMKLGKGKFDTQGKHGGPFKLVKHEDSSLADVLADDGSCEPGGGGVRRGPPPELLVRRTEDPLPPTAGARKLTGARAKVKPLTEGKGGIAPLALALGQWDDDGDGVPEMDEASCTGPPTVSTLVVNP
jgi:hypothetical protein